MTVRVCPSCGERNPDRARFCVRCGSPLTRDTRSEAERKVVTVLFCDLAGFTARSDRADPEDVKATLRPFHSRIAREIEGHGGTLDKFIGDAVVGVFGAPASHEDDPERAVRAAIRIHDAIDELNAERPGLELAARIGVDTGEAVVVVGPGPQVDERVTGEVLARAAILQTAAPVGGIAVGENTHRATRDLFVFEELPAVTPKSGDPAVRSWRPLSISRLERERPDSPFVGRAEESALLRAAYRRAAGGPSVQLVTVTGEPGVGKTRLIQELAAHLDREPDIIRWRQGRCRPYGEGVAFSPLADIVKAEAGVLESDAADDVAAKLSRAIESFVNDPTENDWLRARLAPLAGLGEAPADRAESFAAWRRWLEAMASQHPTVLVFEDLHWADPALLDFIEHVIEWSTGLPLLVLCAARPELFERRPTWGGGKRNATAISLRPLSGTETAMLISGLLEPTVLTADTRTALLERAGGNPLYAEEFARMLSELSGGDTDPADVPVPETVHAIIGARLDTLPPESKGLLQDAAVFGKVFWAGALAATSGRPAEDVRARLHDMAKQELIRPARSSTVRSDAEYSFWHLLVRDVAYEQIPRADRGAKHRAAADWIAQVAGERTADRAEALAYHYALAAELAGSDVDDELRAKAAGALALAADRVWRLDAGSADRFLSRALALLPPGRPDRPGVLVRAGEVSAALGRFAESRDRFEEAIAAFRDADDPLGLGDAKARFARSLFRLGDVRRSEQLLTEAVEMLEAEPPGPELARAYSRRAGNALLIGDWVAARDFADEALALARELGMHDEAVRAQQCRGAARCELGEADGLADLWAALRLGVELGLGEETVVTYANLAYQLWIRDGPTIALQAATSALEFAERRGFSTEAMWAKAGQLEALFDLGRWDEVEKIALEIEDWDREEGGGQLRTFAEIYRGTVLTFRGDVRAATLLAEEFLPRVRILERVEFVAPALVAGAANELARGHTGLAVGLVREFAEATTGHPGYRAQHLPSALRVLVSAGAQTHGLIPEEPPVSTRDRNCLTTADAILLEAEGRTEEAAGRFAEAGTAWLAYGSVLELGHARFGEGRCRRVLSDPGAEEPLREARDRFASLGAPPLVAAVEAFLA